ncbi:MAG: hypothetical protein ACRERR_06540 [Moraxellaceae bacterium]
MTDKVLYEEKTINQATKWRAKAWMARWSMMLWVVFTAAISIASWQLFPGAHFWVDGGWQGIKLVTSVDLVLGPVLFMLVANPAKTRHARRMDTASLLTVQILAMTWGSFQVYTQRPVAISYMPEGFAMPLVMNDFTLQKINPDTLPASRIGDLPAFYVSLPTGKNALADLLKLLNQSPAPVAAQSSLLTPLFSHEPQVFSNTKRFQNYWSGEGTRAWQAWTSRHDGRPASDYRFIILMGRYGNAILVLDQKKHLVGHIQLPGEVLPAALQGT